MSEVIVPYDNHQLKFQIGDVVRLKSGGPKMTVQSIVTQLNFKRNPKHSIETRVFSGQIICQWFEEGLPILKSEKFWQYMVVAVTGEDCSSNVTYEPVNKPINLLVTHI